MNKQVLIIILACLCTALVVSAVFLLTLPKENDVLSVAPIVSDNNDISVSSYDSSEQSENKDFRNASWGMSKDEVISLEGEQPARDLDTSLLFINKTVAEMPAEVLYSFDENDRLIGGIYNILNRHTNDNDYIDDYNKLKNSLISKYGEPSFDNVNWKNDLYKDEPDHYGFAVTIGHLEYISNWGNPNGEIGLMLTGDNYKLSLVILYQSKEATENTKSNNEVCEI